ncbi:MAG: DUF11 domain-containing protein, partial [Actinomycetota bacterium]|nr:DUF11 domain-containing protein [Actinomycetota bacterium]
MQPGLGLAPGALAADRVVTKQADSNDGACGADCSLREAIGAAATGDSVVVPAGNYALSGGFGELAVAGAVTISIVGTTGSAATTVQAPPNARVLNVSNASANVTLQGLTITGGNVTSTNGGGGGILNAGTLTLRESVVRANNVTGNGGIPRGGGILSTGPLSVEDSLVTENNVTSTNGGIPSGGGIDASGGLSVLRSTLSANTTTITTSGGIAVGGAIDSSAQTASTTVTDSRIVGNSALNGAIPEGAGMAVTGNTSATGTLTITRSTIADNLAEATIDGATIPEGGGLVAINVSTSIVDSTISGNRSRDMTPGGLSDSGGLLLGGDNRTFTIVNSTISANRTESTAGGNGGGLRVFGNNTSLDITNTTIANNVASQRAGGIERQSGTLTLRNTILSGNQAPAGAGCFGTIASAGNNLESGDTCGLTAAGDLPNTDPQLGALADNGGPTLTHAIPIASPAIDAGQATGCPAADQRGVSRALGGICDIGAFELPHADLAVTQTVAPATATAGFRATYTARVTNRGPAPSPATVLRQTLPTGVTLLSVTPGRGTCDAGAPVLCQLGTLAAGESVDVAFVVRTAGLGTFPAQAAVSGGELDRTPGDLSAGADLAVGDMGLSLTNTVVRLGPLAPRMTRRTVPTGTTARFTLSEA